MYGIRHFQFKMPFTQSNGNDKKAVPCVSSRVQEKVWAGIRNLESIALKMYLNP